MIEPPVTRPSIASIGFSFISKAIILIKDLTDRGLELLKYNDGDLYAFLDDNGIYVNITFDGSMTKYTMDGRKV